MDSKKTLEIMKNLAFLSGKNDSRECEEAISNSIKALEKLEKINFVINDKDYPNADECDYGHSFGCEYALMIKDIEKIISDLDT